MSTGNGISHLPLLKIFIPFCIGILSAYYLLPLLYVWVTILVLSVIAYFSVLKSGVQTRAKAQAICLLLISCAFGGTVYSMRPIPSFDCAPPVGEMAYARIYDLTASENSIRTLADVEINGNSFKAQIVISGSNYSIKEGKVIAFSPNFKKIRNLGNPKEIDFAKMMKNKYITFTQHLKQNEYTIIGEKHSFISQAKAFRRTISNAILESKLSPDAQQFMIATTLGDKSILDDEISDRFRQLGLAHILALSGLHVGIIGTIIYLLLFPLDFIRNGKRIRLCVCLLLLITYAYVTGCSPSVIRAVVMSMFVSVAYMTHRKNSIGNALIASALLILSVSPVSLFDVGFQLSYAAVCSILLFTDILNPVPIKNFRFRSAVNVILMTVVPMFCTWIISGYYFSTFPPMFFIANLFMVPILPFLMMFGIFAALSPWTIVTGWFNSVYHFISIVLGYFANMEISHVTNVYITFPALIIYMIGILALYITIKKRNIICGYAVSIIFLFAFFVNFIQCPTPPNIVIFNSFSDTQIAHIENGTLYLQGNIDNRTMAKFKRKNTRFLSYYRINDVVAMCNDSIISPYCRYTKKHAYINGVSYAILDKAIKRNQVKQVPLEVDYLIISGTYYSSIARVLEYYSPKQIILSGAIFPKKRQQFIEQCEHLNIPYYDISECGAFIGQ